MEARAARTVDRIHALPCKEASAPQARELAREVAGHLMTETQQSNLELALTEVVGNAVRHSRSDDDMVIALTPKPSFLCVRVTDSGAGLLPRPGAMATEPGAGYGLFLVEQLTRRWGMTREDGKTRVWFEIDYELPEDAAA